MRYLSQFDFPAGLLNWVVAAWLAELALYGSTASTSLRRKAVKVAPARLAVLMAASAALPYLLYAPMTGCFQAGALGLLVSLAAVLAFWYIWMPRRPLADLAFVTFAAAVAMARPWRQIYCSPVEQLPMQALGQLMWIRVGILSALAIGKVEGTGFGWWPSGREWKIGVLHFAAFLPVGWLVGTATGFVQWQWRLPAGWDGLWMVVGTFAGMLWVVAASEEFFFRGLLQNWLSCWLGSKLLGCVMASVAFGLVHLPFRGFPNWRFAVLASLAGLFYGRAYVVAGGIRASMVAHALTNTVWRALVA